MPPAADSMPPAVDSMPPAVDSMPPTADSIPPAVDSIHGYAVMKYNGIAVDLFTFVCYTFKKQEKSKAVMI